MPSRLVFFTRTSRLKPARVFFCFRLLSRVCHLFWCAVYVAPVEIAVRTPPVIQAMVSQAILGVRWERFSIFSGTSRRLVKQFLTCLQDIQFVPKIQSCGLVSDYNIHRSMFRKPSPRPWAEYDIDSFEADPVGVHLGSAHRYIIFKRITARFTCYSHGIFSESRRCESKLCLFLYFCWSC